MLLRFLPGFALLFLDYFFAEFALGCKRAAVNDAKGIFVFLFGQGAILNDFYRF